MADTKVEQLRKLLSQYAMRSGEEFKRGMPVVVREAHKSKCWKHAIKPDGTSFTSLAEWLIVPPPSGCGLGCTRDAITYDELTAACEKVAPDVAEILAFGRPITSRGRPANGTRTLFKTGNGENKKRATLAARLAKEHPAIYRDFLAGKHPSIRAAAEVAGIVAAGHDPTMRLKAYWRKATKAQRRAFLKWVEAGGA